MDDRAWEEMCRLMEEIQRHSKAIPVRVKALWDATDQDAQFDAQAQYEIRARLLQASVNRLLTYGDEALANAKRRT